LGKARISKAIQIARTDAAYRLYRMGLRPLSPGVVHDIGVIQVTRSKPGTAQVPDTQPSAVRRTAVQIGPGPRIRIRQPNFVSRKVCKRPGRSQDALDRLSSSDAIGRVHVAAVACHPYRLPRITELRRSDCPVDEYTIAAV